MTPIIKIGTTPECCHPTFGAYPLPYRVEVDGCAVGPVLKEKEAELVSRWLNDAWTDLVKP